MKKVFSLILVGALIGFLPLFLSGDKIDLVELKKKEEERRKKLKETGTETIKVTEEVLKKYSSGTDRSSGTTSPQVDTSKARSRQDQPGQPTDQADKDPKKTREYWQERATFLRERIRQLEQLIEEKDKEIRELTLQFNMMSEFFQRTRLDNRIQEATRIRDEYRESLASYRQKLETLSEEARKLYIPPGWLR